MTTLKSLSTAILSTSSACLFVFLCIRSTPETLIGDVYAGPVPLQYLIYGFGLFLSVTYVLIARPRILLTKKFMALSLLFSIGFINGVVQENGMRYIGIDSIFVSGMFYGLLWSMSHAASRVVSYVRNAAIPALLVFGLLTIGGTQTGFISPAFDSARVYTYSQFDIIFLLCAFTPIACAANSGGSPKASFHFFATFAPLVVALMLTYGAATRSGLGCCTVAAMSLASLQFSGIIRLGLLWAIGLLVVICSLSDYSILGDSLLADRLSGTTLHEEDRFTEVLLMLDDLRGHEVLGRGLGSRFATNIDAADPYALAPHIGVLALLHKSGFFLFSAVVLMPIVFCGAIAAISMFNEHWRFGPLRTNSCFAWAMVICVVQMSLSSGWDVLHLFFVSAFFALGSQNVGVFARRQRVSERNLTSPARRPVNS
jgi:hypothetical protein